MHAAWLLSITAPPGMILSLSRRHAASELRDFCDVGHDPRPSFFDWALRCHVAAGLIIE
jgi:hypothetical protein